MLEATFGWRSLLALSLSAGLTAQAPARTRAVPVAPAAGWFVDAHVADGIWARGRDWKAHWHDGSCRFTACHQQPGAAAPVVELSLVAVTLAATDLPLGKPRLERAGADIAFVRPELRERWTLGERALEHSFVFEQLPRRGELRLRLAVRTAMAVIAGEQGLRFENTEGTLGYATCVAIDGAGRRSMVPMHWNAGSLELVVPAGFLEHVTMPLIVDPTLQVVSGFTTPHPGPAQVAWDAFTGQHLVVWESRFSPTDGDVVAQRIGGDGVPIGGPIAIDITGGNVERPRVANHAFAGCWLCVAEGGGGGLPRVAVSRRIAVDGATVPVLAVAGGGFGGITGDALHADIGGNPQLDHSARFLVVFERQDAAGFTEVWAAQADGAGVVLPGSTQLLEGGILGEALPVVSSSCGIDAPSEQRWFVAWQRRSARGDRDIRACQIAWNGVLAVAPHDVDADADDDAEPRVTAPNVQYGERYAMVVFTQRGAMPVPQLTMLDLAGVVRHRSAFAVPGITFTLNDADSDGSRFALVGTATPTAGGPAMTMAASLAWLPVAGTLRLDVLERPFTSTDPESDPVLFGQRGSAGASGAFYSLVQLRQAPGGVTLDLATWDGRQPGPQLEVREPHCGNIGPNDFTIVGASVMGGELWFEMPAQGFSGFMVGTPADLQLPVCNCRVGVVDANMVANPYVTILPCEPNLVGARFSTQGYVVGGSACLGVFDLSYTIDITIR